MRPLVGFLAVVLAASATRSARAEGTEPASVAPSPREDPAHATEAPRTGSDDEAELEGGSRGAPPPLEASKKRGPPLRDERNESAVTSHWYGWQTLTVDGVAIALLAGSLAGTRANGGVLGLSGTTYALGAPIVHLVHGRVGTAGLSLLARVGLPMVGLFAGAAAADCHSSSSDEGIGCGGGAMAAGLLIGAAAGMALDAALLAREDIPRERRSSGLSVSPTLGVTKSSGTVGLAGAF